jgi:hypothetical protein
MKMERYPGEEAMTILRLNRNVAIENLRGYRPEVIEDLRTVLEVGARAAADPKRPGFYDLDDGSRGFYIHVSPVSGKVFLLAVWHNESPSEEEVGEHRQAPGVLQASPAYHCVA